MLWYHSEIAIIKVEVHCRSETTETGENVLADHYADYLADWQAVT